MSNPTKAVRITVDNVSDGLGGEHFRGQIVEFEIELADLMISKGMAEQVSREEIKRAEQNAWEQKRRREMESNASDARIRMALFDNMPPEIRAKAKEFGDDVIREYINRIEEQTRKAQGLKPWSETDVTNDAGFDSDEYKFESEPPKKKRGRPRKQPS